MKTVKISAFQGDVFLKRIDGIPDAATLRSNMDTTIAHSETGHNHVAVADMVKIYDVPGDELTSYMDIIGTPADIVHQRSFDTHETLRLPPGKWMIRRQREHAPEGWRRASD